MQDFLFFPRFILYQRILNYEASSWRNSIGSRKNVYSNSRSHPKVSTLNVIPFCFHIYSSSRCIVVLESISDSLIFLYVVKCLCYEASNICCSCFKAGSFHYQFQSCKKYSNIWRRPVNAHNAAALKRQLWIQFRCSSKPGGTFLLAFYFSFVRFKRTILVHFIFTPKCSDSVEPTASQLAVSFRWPYGLNGLRVYSCLYYRLPFSGGVPYNFHLFYILFHRIAGSLDATFSLKWFEAYPASSYH